MGHEPMMPAERARKIREWQDAVFESEMARRETTRVEYLGLAASKSSDVTAVDVNPHAVEAARENAEANGVAARVRVLESDPFDRVDGAFDLVVFDPPFRWFAPRDVRERNTTDEEYRTLAAFFRDVPRYPSPGGRILLFFGTSGDADYLYKLIGEGGLDAEKLRIRNLEKGGLEVEYFTLRLTRGAE